MLKCIYFGGLRRTNMIYPNICVAKPNYLDALFGLCCFKPNIFLSAITN